MAHASDGESKTRRLLPHLSELGEGFGSAYERYAIGTLTESLVRKLDIRTVAEWPANGVLGVPGLKSLPLAFAGCEVTLLNPSEELLQGALAIWHAAEAPEPHTLVASPEDEAASPPDAYDLVWSFCAFEHARDENALARAMVRAAKRYVLVFVQNAWMPGVHLHRLHHRLQRRTWDHGRLQFMSAEAVAARLDAAGARIVSLGGCDLPPWPDIDVRLPRWRTRERPLEIRAGARPYGPGDARLSPAAAARVFSRPARLSAPMRFLSAWHDHVERHVPVHLLRFLAHHPYVLAEKPR